MLHESMETDYVSEHAIGVSAKEARFLNMLQKSMLWKTGYRFKHATGVNGK